ncbi:MAG: OsmC family protein [Lachnospiraceae bacterium]|nr:OsmC family protein [Lachnospiraceae bacterium]
MALKTYHAAADRRENLQVEVKARNFSLIVDEPEQSGGNNQGMNPVEMLLGSIAACQTITAAIYADFYGITLEELRVEVEGDMDSDGFSGADPAVRPGFQKIRSTFHIKSSAPRIQLVQLLKMVEKQCPVGDSIGHGVSFDEPVLDLSGV